MFRKLLLTLVSSLAAAAALPSATASAACQVVQVCELNCQEVCKINKKGVLVCKDVCGEFCYDNVVCDSGGDDDDFFDGVTDCQLLPTEIERLACYEHVGGCALIQNQVEREACFAGL